MKVTPRFTPERPSFAMVWTTIVTVHSPSNEVDNDGDNHVECSFDGGGWDGSGSVVAGDDCNDGDTTVYTGATELCDGQDNNCDNSIPANEVDNDGDNRIECSIDGGGWDGIAGIVSGVDCDDGDATIYTGATELCDGQDNDCDSLIPSDEVDQDNDNHVVYIDTGGWDGTGSVVAGVDCDESDATIYTGATELCDGLDNDCDSSLPSNEVDNDGDNHVECSFDGGGWDGSGSVVAGDDCNDGDTTVYTGATELCDGQDNDCTNGIPSNEVDDDSDGHVECSIDIGGWNGLVTNGFF